MTYLQAEYQCSETKWPDTAEEGEEESEDGETQITSGRIGLVAF